MAEPMNLYERHKLWGLIQNWLRAGMGVPKREVAEEIDEFINDMLQGKRLISGPKRQTKEGS